VPESEVHFFCLICKRGESNSIVNLGLEYSRGGKGEKSNVGRGDGKEGRKLMKADLPLKF